MKDLAPKPHLKPGVSDTPGFGEPFWGRLGRVGSAIGPWATIWTLRGSLWEQLEHLRVPFGHPGALRHQPLSLQ